MTETPSSQVWWRRQAPALAAAAVAVGVAALLVLPGTGGGGESADRAAPEVKGASSRDMGGLAAGSPTGGGTAGTAPGAGIAPQTLPGSAGAGTSTADADDGRTRVVRTGSLSLVVDDGKVPATVSRVQAVVTAARGYVADSTSQESGEHPVATLTARVPVEAFDQVLAKVRGLGAKVVSAETGGRDVTATYADTRAQIQSLQAARSRFLAILAGAKTISETLTVQQRVDDVQRQIDRLEAQRRVLADSSDLATLTVSVGEDDDRVLVAEEQSGWSKAWDDATDGFVGGLQGLLARSGRALLVLLVAVALYPLARVLVRRTRRHLANPADGAVTPIA